MTSLPDKGTGSSQLLGTGTLPHGNARVWLSERDGGILAELDSGTPSPQRSVHAGLWATADIGYGALGILNFTVLIFTSGIALKTLKDYDQQRKAGLDPVFDPKKLGLKHANFWEDLNAEATSRARPGLTQRTHSRRQTP